jgi:hypothetical protein
MVHCTLVKAITGLPKSIIPASTNSNFKLSIFGGEYMSIFRPPWAAKANIIFLPLCSLNGMVL